jgi:hypothetical protein
MLLPYDEEQTFTPTLTQRARAAVLKVYRIHVFEFVREI